MHLTIDHDSAVPPFEQVRAQVARLVADGQVPAGTRLPTVRTLAAELSLAVNTVARAYKELEADGVLETLGRRGSFVRSGRAVPADVGEAVSGYVAAARRGGLTRAEALRLVEDAWPV